MIAAGPGSFVVVAVICAGIVYVLLLLLERFAPARFLTATMRGQDDDAVPVRQLGGLAIFPVLATVLTLLAVDHFGPIPGLCLLSAFVLVWIVGLLDDRHHLSVSVRLAAQTVSAILTVVALHPAGFLPGFPVWLEGVILVGFLVWLMNVTNFMDGMDLMTVSGIGWPSLLAGLLLLNFGSESIAVIAAAALCGVLAGFIPFNTPSARLYLGDNGSLVLGLGAGVLSLLMAAQLGVLPALLVFGYYHADAGYTLARRIANRENIFSSHTQHLYQRALQHGISINTIVSAVVLVGLIFIAAAYWAVIIFS